MRSKFVRHSVVIAAMILGTWILGWMAVPIVAFATGFLTVAPRHAALHAGVAWTVLMLADAVHSAFPRLVGMLSGVMGIPSVLLIVLTILFPMILGWSAATIGTAARSIRRGTGAGRAESPSV